MPQNNTRILNMRRNNRNKNSHIQIRLRNNPRRPKTGKETKMKTLKQRIINWKFDYWSYLIGVTTLFTLNKLYEILL